MYKLVVSRQHRSLVKATCVSRVGFVSDATKGTEMLSKHFCLKGAPVRVRPFLFLTKRHKYEALTEKQICVFLSKYLDRV